MKSARLKLAIFVGGLATLCAWPAPPQGQERQPSLGEIARRAREQKKKAPIGVRVWTNDNLPTIPGAAVSVVGPPAEVAAPGAEERPPVTPAAGSEEEDKERKETEAALAAEKSHLARAKNELDLFQRDLYLQGQQYYSNPGYSSDTAGKARLDALRGQIDAKQQEVQQAQRKIAALEEQLENLKRRSGTDKQASPPPKE